MYVKEMITGRIKKQLGIISINPCNALPQRIELVKKRLQHANWHNKLILLLREFELLLIYQTGRNYIRQAIEEKRQAMKRPKDLIG